jgi:TPP-dependent pyruvate/acetoin dehydrogenase alpha subunit
VGDFHEALNFAGVQQLPVIFVCENNQYAYSVPIEKSMAIDDVADRAEGYGFDGVAINGNDVLAVYQATLGALARARNGDGPTLIECKTYRWHGHSEHDKAFYRTNEELAMWKSRDPIPTFTTYLTGLHVLTPEKTAEIESRVTSTIDDAVEFAMNAPEPHPEDAVTDLYA